MYTMSKKWKRIIAALLCVVMLMTTFAFAEDGGSTENPNPGVTEPGQPTDPTDPTEPTDPTDPTDPTEPTDPTDPTDPTEPTDPTDPTEPTDPTDPTDPTEPTEPTEPDQPTEPIPVTVSIQLDQDSFIYNGSLQKPTVTVSVSDASLTAADYTVTNNGGIDAGVYSVTVTVTKTGYTGSASASYTITAQPLDYTVSVNPVSGVYTGMKHEPAVTITSAVDNIESLVNISWSGDLTNVGSYTVNVTPKSGNYTGFASASYTITAQPLDYTVSVNPTSGVYTGVKHEPAVTITSAVDNIESLVNISWSGDLTNVGSYIVNVTPKSGNYSGSASATYTIEKASLNVTVELDQTTFTFNGENQKAAVKSVTFTDASGAPVALTAGDYSITNNGGVNVGSYSVTATVTNPNYTGSGSASFAINPMNVADTMVVTLSSSTFDYNEAEQKPTVSVSVNGKALVSGTDYDVSWPSNDAGAYTDIGTWNVTVTTKGNYTGSKTVSYEIKPDTSLVVLELSADTFVYNGKHQQPEAKIVSKYTTTKYWSIQYPANAVNADTYTVTATIWKGTAYERTLTAQYTITPVTDDFVITLSKDSFTYDRTTHAPTVTVTAGGLTLKDGEQITITMPEDQINAGTKTITVAVKDTVNFACATATATYVINKVTAPLEVTLSEYTYVYTRTEQTPDVVVQAGGLTLVHGEEAVITMTENRTDVGVKTVTVKTNPDSNFDCEEVSVTYEITPVTEDMVITCDTQSFVYNGVEQRPVLTISAAGLSMTEGVDFDLTWPEDSKNVGKKSVTVTPKGNFACPVVVVEYEITPYVLTDADVKWTVVSEEGIAENTYVYNRTPQHPTVVVTYPMGKDAVPTEIQEPADFTRQFADGSVNVGVYTTSVTGVGNFAGTVSFTYEITPVTKDMVITCDTQSFVYNGVEQRPVLTIEAAGLSMTEGVDFDLTWPEDSTNVGEKSVTVTPKGNFACPVVVVDYEITPYVLTDADVKWTVTPYEHGVQTANTFTYNGLAQHPTVVVTYPMGKDATATEILELADFIRQLADGSTLVGEYTTSVTGIGNFAGTVEFTYHIDWMPSVGIDLTGHLNDATGWYIADGDSDTSDDAVRISPKASGWTISKDFAADGEWTDYVTYADSANVQAAVYLRDPEGYITNVETATYMQDTQAPVIDQNFTFTRENFRVHVLADDNCSGTVITMVRILTGEVYNGVPSSADSTAILLTAEIHVGGEFTLIVRDVAGNVAFDDSIEFIDSDGDGLNQPYENFLGGSDSTSDSDSDGLSDLRESQLGTDPGMADTDGDGLSDSQEVETYKTNPKKSDTNSDGIGDLQAVLLKEIYGLSDKSSTALDIVLGNILNKAAARFDKAAMIEALQVLADNGYLSETPYTPNKAIDRTSIGAGSQMISMTTGSLMRFVAADMVNDILYGWYTRSDLLVTMDVASSGLMSARDALNLKEVFGAGVKNLAVMADDSASLLVLANWDSVTNSAANNLVVYVPGHNMAWTIADSNGATAFDVAPDGSSIAYLKDGVVNVLDLVTGNPGMDPLTAEGDMVAYTADGKVITAMEGAVATVYTVTDEGESLTASTESFTGVYFTAQPYVSRETNGNSLCLRAVLTSELALMREMSMLDVQLNGFAGAAGPLTMPAYYAPRATGTGTFSLKAPDLFN